MLGEKNKMKLSFLGTGAAEGIPSIYCSCKTCQFARKYKGKDIRNRSAVLIDNELCIDFGPDIHHSFQSMGLDASKLKILLITHSHFDHFYPENLEIRSKRYLREEINDLIILGNPAVFYKLSLLGYSDKALHIIRKEAPVYKNLKIYDYMIIPIIANHAHEFGGALNFVIKKKERTVIYATDTGMYAEEQMVMLKGLNADAIILDATNLYACTSENHLNISGFLSMIKELRLNNCIKNDSLIIASHFAHGGVPNHRILEKRLKEHGIIAAYDSMQIEI